MNRKDFVYKAECGCMVTLYARDGYKSSMFIPSQQCEDHKYAHQCEAIDQVIEDARDMLRQVTQNN